MSLTVGSSFALRMLGRSTASLGRSYERLASGLRIVRAGDDAAGLAIASQLAVSTRVFNQGVRNANDTISALNIAQGSLEQFSSVLIRMRELATQAANGTLGQAQRVALDRENAELYEEYNRILATTTFNGRSLLLGSDRSADAQLGFGPDASIDIDFGRGLERTVGTGQFNTPTAVDNGENGVFTFDINGDGHVDIIEAPSATSRLMWRLGNGDGTFGATQQLLIGGANTVGAAVGDFNGDGRQDVTVALANGSVIVAQNNGSGFSAGPTSTIGGLSILGITAADLDGDGDDDLVVGNAGGQLFRSINNGSGTFTSASIGSFDSASSLLDRLQLADINGDGRIDLLSKSNSFVSVQVISIFVYLSSSWK